MSSHIPEKRAVNGEKGFSRGALSLVTSFGHAKEVTYKKSVLKKMGDGQVRCYYCEFRQKTVTFKPTRNIHEKISPQRHKDTNRLFILPLVIVDRSHLGKLQK